MRGICPTGAIATSRSDPPQPVFHPLLCTGCTVCAEFCPQQAIRLSPRRSFETANCIDERSSREPRKSDAEGAPRQRLPAARDPLGFRPTRVGSWLERLVSPATRLM
jgi:formate hydrogenlyase subunit 6/NADH:ubiquinone oxidoreductase subunit I